MKRLFAVITLLLFAHILFAQPPVTEEQAKEELEKLGVDDDVVRAKLLERGIDIDNVNQNDPAELLEIQKAIEEVLAEIELEKTSEDTLPNLEPRPVEEQVIVDSTEAAIQEIKSTDNEEDVAEEFIEEFRDSLPASTIFGQHIFREQSIKLYRQSEDVKPPDSYVLGFGDIIAVSIWGTSQEGGVYEINKSGYITPSKMPRIYLKGISFGKAKELIRKRFSNYYSFRPEEFELSINYSRTITVNLVGEVNHYGSFTIPATNTAFNALVAGGGPSDIGSVRNIQLIRAGQQPKRIDVYEYLLNPSVQDGFYLQENDYIHVPIAERLVTISGAVKRSFTFELTRGEELKKIIEFAGGFTVNAYKGNLQIRRFVNNEEIIIDVDFTKYENSQNDFQLLNGDVIQVKSIAKPYKNFVEVSGAVEFSGRFELTPGMKVSDLVNKSTLAEEARRDVAFLQRFNVDGTVKYEKLDLSEIISDENSAENLTLQPRDQLLIYNQPQFVDNAEFSVVGSVRNPVKLPFGVGKEIKIDDAILLAGGLLPDATSFGYIIRTDFNNKKKKEIIRVDIQTAIENPESPENIAIQPFDQLRIYSMESLTYGGSVSINGAVRKATDLPYAQNLTVSNVIAMAGGLSPNATDFGYITRRDLTNEDNRTIIRVDLNEALSNPNSDSNISLEPFDVFTVYSTEIFTDDDLPLVIRGSVRKPGRFQFAKNFTLKDIITLAGGLTFEASRSRIEVFRIIFKEDEAIEKVMATFEVDENLNITSSNNENFELAPFDLVVVRKIPYLEFQEEVSIVGEVKYPGYYPLLDNNERLFSIIERSGGMTEEAFTKGATLYRRENDTGYIILELDKILKNKKSINNLILKAGDIISIPKVKDLVTIIGATKANELYSDEILNFGKINVAYHKRKNAKWYVKNYTAGVGKDGQKKRITVRHANGEVEKTKTFLFFKKYPSVKEGSVVTVGAKPPKKRRTGKDGEKKNVNWGKVLAETLTQATAVLSLILLIQNVNK